MDLRGLDKEWRGFSDLEIRKVKGSPDHPPAARAPVPGTKRASMANSRAGSQQQRRLGGGGGGGGQSVPRPTRSQQEVAPEDTSADSSLDQADSALDQEPLWALPPPEGDRECEGRSLKDPVPEERDADTESAGNDRLQPFTPVEEDIVKVKKPSELELRLQKEKNEKTKELVEKRLRERYVLSQQESENLKQVQRELASLDQLATRDIGVLQEKIESAGRRYDRSRRRYEAAEKEFVAAKLELFRSQEQKELLSEHLCAIIRETELRKSRKLSQLCQALGVSDITQ